MQITAAQLTKIAGGKPDKANINSIVVALNTFGERTGLDRPHRLAQFTPQILHENGRFRYDRELWGPTAAQKRYERNFSAAWPPTKTDPTNRLAHQLGNSVKGDGKRFAGRGPIQLTGRGNVTRFYKWCQAQGFDPPDFTKNPDLINTDPWEGLSAIWYWDVGNPTGKSLNVFADTNDIEMITRRINGGLNGYDDRLALYTRTALVLAGYEPTDVRGFQIAAQKSKLLPAGKDQVDGIAGPQTRAALHMTLAQEAPKTVVAAAPVTKQVDVRAPGKGVADAATGGGIATVGLGGVVQTLQEQLTPFSVAGSWIGTLVVVLIIVGAVITIGGLLYRWWAARKKAATMEALNVQAATT